MREKISGWFTIRGEKINIIHYINLKKKPYYVNKLRKSTFANPLFKKKTKINNKQSTTTSQLTRNRKDLPQPEKGDLGKPYS